MLREVEIRAQNLKNGNDELMHERNQLLQKIDG
jgi:chromosome segregation ATPase